jgi:hypothetical protein
MHPGREESGGSMDPFDEFEDSPELDGNRKVLPVDWQLWAFPSNLVGFTEAGTLTNGGNSSWRTQPHRGFPFPCT